jgi:hypothetical protein
MIAIFLLAVACIISGGGAIHDTWSLAAGDRDPAWVSHLAGAGLILVGLVLLGIALAVSELKGRS